MKKEKYIHKVGFLLLCFYCMGSASAQISNTAITSSLAKQQLLMGDQTQLNVQTKTPVDKPITGWFNLPDTFNHLEIVHRSRIDSTLEGTVKTYKQTFTITGFDSGVWSIPPLVIMSNNTSVSSDPLELTIVPAHLNDSTYHDIRDIINVPTEDTPWWYWVAGILSAILLGILVWLWLKSRKNIPKIVADQPVGLVPLEEALQKLARLKSENLPQKGEWKKYYSSVTDIYKIYNERRFQNGALQQTTDELLVQANSKLSKTVLGELAETLRIADAVKFARYQPEQERSSTDIDVIEKVVKRLDMEK